METRNIFAVYAGINLRRMPMRLTNPEGRACVLIRLALSAEKPCSFTMTTNTTQTTNAATRSAAIPFLCRNRLPLRHLPCRSCPGKTDFKRMRYPVHVILTALSMFYLGKNSFRNIALILRTVMNIQVSHTTISNWCTKFAPLFQNIALELMPTLNFNSDEWHADETVVKIRGMKYYLWLIVDSETRFVLSFHLSRHRDSPQAFSLLNSVKHLGKPGAIVTDRYSAYKVPVKAVLGVKHIRVQSFSDDITNNLIECFNKQFKAWYKTKQGFASFDSANNLIAVFLFFYNFVRPHSALDGLTPAQVAGLNLSARSKRKLFLVA
jgi:transposase-like protein